MALFVQLLQNPVFNSHFSLANLLLVLSSCFLKPVKLDSSGDKELTSAVVEYLRTMDANMFKTKEVNGQTMCVGYLSIASDGSSGGINVGLNVDLSDFSRQSLREAGVPDEVINQINDQFYKPKNADEVKKLNINPDDLVMDMESCLLLSQKVGSNGLTKYLLENAKEYGKYMTNRGRQSLFSVRRWCLKSSIYYNKCIEINGQNHIWSEIQDKEAEDNDFRDALVKTRHDAYEAELWDIVEQLDREIWHLTV